ncbi:MAG: DUF4367 domain-containing protein [Oscillospiraceae bacterium]|nr:DUF4367 domain-containing protein [Oscillospiraceae bacterium]
MAYNLSEKAIAEKYEDLLFTKVMALYAEEESEKILSELGEETADPKAIQKLFDKKERSENLRTLWKYSKKILQFAAMVVFVVVISVSSVVVASAEVRETVAEALYHLVLEEHEEYTRVSIGESTNYVDPEIYDWEGAYAPTYMPNGFIFTDKIDTGTGYYITYGNGNEYIMFYQDSNHVGANFDTENADIVDEIMIGSSKGLYIYKDGYTIVSWNIGNTFMFLEGTADTYEFIKIAEGIKPLGKTEEPTEEYKFVDPENYNFEGAYAPTYVPKGFSFGEMQDLDSQKIVTYFSETNFISFLQAQNVIQQADTENADRVEQIKINNSEGLMVVKGELTSITWNIGDTLLTVLGNCSTEELINMAQSIKPVN